MYLAGRIKSWPTLGDLEAVSGTELAAVGGPRRQYREDVYAASPDASDAVNAAIIKTVTQLYSSNADPKTLMTACDAQVSRYLNNSGPGGIS